MYGFTFYSYALCSVFFGIFTLLLLTGWRGRFQGVYLTLAAAATTSWALLASLHAYYGDISLQYVWAMEVVRNLLWLFFVLRLLRPLAEGVELYTRMLFYVRLSSLLVGLLLLLVLSGIRLNVDYLPSLQTQNEFVLISQLLLAVLGMALVEQLFRNTPEEQRWGIKYMCFGLGAMFVCDFYLYTDALLFHRLDLEIWSARGAVNALAVPLIALTVARNSNWQLDVFVSRRMVFHTTTLFGAGLYMLLMALAGYYIKIYGGEWGAVLQITFLFGAIMLLVVLLFSGQLRARVKVFLNKHFFSYRYDYREEWLHLIALLTGEKSDKPLNERIIWAIGNIVDSTGGFLWLWSDKKVFRCLAHFNYPQQYPLEMPGDSSLIHFLSKNNWIIDLDEYRQSSDLYGELQLPRWMLDDRDIWLIVPLSHDEELLGIVVLMKPRAPQTLNWENRDLLKTAGMQAASYVALSQAAEALAEARQFEGFNRLSAFVIHDLKNLIAQLSLVASNAVKHKHNPEFMDDAVVTIENAVNKMNRLMSQLRSADTGGMHHQKTELVGLLQAAVAAKTASHPVPVLEAGLEPVVIFGEPDRLSSVVGHVIQNAQDATPSDGMIRVGLSVTAAQAIVTVKDSGVGMDAEFIEKRLFKAFDSTKGLTGMGIGAYECREVVTAHGGQVLVESEPGIGTTFSIILPLWVESTYIPRHTGPV